MEEQINQIDTKTFLVFSHRDMIKNKFSAPELLTENYTLAEQYANAMAVKNDTAYTIAEYLPVDFETLVMPKLVQVRLKYNKDYDEFTTLSITPADKEKEPSVIVSDDDESVFMGKFVIKCLQGDTYDSIINCAQSMLETYLKENPDIQKQA